MDLVLSGLQWSNCLVYIDFPCLVYIDFPCQKSCTLTRAGSLRQKLSSNCVASLRLKKLGLHCTPYHPQSDGFVERFNRTPLNLLSTSSGQHQSEWDTNLRKACLAYHTSVQSTTGYSPFFLMFGREARLPIDIGHEQPTLEVPAHQQYGQYVQNQSEAFLRAFEVVRKNVSMKQCSQQELYNRKIPGDPRSPHK